MRIIGAGKSVGGVFSDREVPTSRSGLATNRFAELPARPRPRHWFGSHLTGSRGGQLSIAWWWSVAGAHELSFQNGRPGGAWPRYQTANVTIG